MKKFIFSVVTLSALLTSCNNNTEDFNNDKDASYEVSAESLFTNSQLELANQMTTPSVNLNPFRFFSQYWSQTTYNDESRYRLTTRRVADNHWNALYRDVLGNLESAKKVINLTGASAERTNKLAIIEVIEVYTFQILVDTYGDIPYTDALNVAIKLPKYDDDTTIYPKLITRLDAAIANLDDSAGSFDKGDVVFGGDVAQWKLFANSIKLKLGTNLADVNPALAQATVEAAYNAGVILNNSQNATFHYPSAAPNYNPLFGDLVASNRNDFVAGNTLVNAMNTLVDPRIGVYFNSVGGVYIGGIYGAANNNFTAFSQIGNKFRTSDLPAQLFEATEANFYLAEAAARGYAVGGTAESYYNSAIQSSFEFWGLSGASAAYLAKPEVAYATATGTWQQKIGTQAWIALFNRGFESWSSYRRLDFPALVAPANAVAAANGVVPKRLTYPSTEATVNGVNYRAAVVAMGEDRLRKKIFWDLN